MDLNKKIEGRMYVRVTEENKNINRVENTYDFSKPGKKGTKKSILGGGISSTAEEISNNLIAAFKIEQKEK